MPTAKEFTVFMEDQPGQIGKLCRALADREVNILAFQAFGTSTHLVLDNLTAAKTVLDAEPYSYAATDIVQVKLPHRPGELARAASRLGEADININYAYGGLEAGTNAPLVFFGVAAAEVGRAVMILDQLAAAAGAT